jgi:hypothetical protein
MNLSHSIRTIFPVILRITFSLMLWTLGVSMNLLAAEPNGHRFVYKFSVERAKMEDLQRWVNAGHEAWCRDPQLVAAASLQRFLPDSVDPEEVSLPVELESSDQTTAIYAVHSLDGATTYRITLRRFDWLLPVAGSLDQTIWIPDQAEILTLECGSSAPALTQTATIRGLCPDASKVARAVPYRHAEQSLRSEELLFPSNREPCFSKPEPRC